MRVILLATDFSGGADLAFDQALALAHKCGASLRLLHVVPATPPLPPSTPISHPAQARFAELLEARRQEARRMLSELADRAAAAGVEATVLDARGAAARQIVGMAREQGADLVVTGSRGHGQDNVFVIGSIAEGVVQRAECNALVARPTLGDGFRRVLAATDLSAASAHVISTALALLEPGGRLELMHVVERGDPFVGLDGTFGDAAIDFKMSWSAAIAEAERELGELAARLSSSEAEVTWRVEDGEPARELIERSCDDIDLVVVGKHPGERTVASVATRVVRHAPCSVLVARHTVTPVVTLLRSPGS